MVRQIFKNSAHQQYLKCQLTSYQRECIHTSTFDPSVYNPTYKDIVASVWTDFSLSNITMMVRLAPEPLNAPLISSIPRLP